MRSFALKNLAAATLMVISLAVAPPPARATVNGDPVAEHGRALIFGTRFELEAAIEALTARGNTDMVATLILAHATGPRRRRRCPPRSPPSPATKRRTGSTGCCGRKAIRRSNPIPATPS